MEKSWGGFLKFEESGQNNGWPFIGSTTGRDMELESGPEGQQGRYSCTRGNEFLPVRHPRPLGEEISIISASWRLLANVFILHFLLPWSIKWVGGIVVDSKVLFRFLWSGNLKLGIKFKEFKSVWSRAEEEKLLLLRFFVTSLWNHLPWTWKWFTFLNTSKAFKPKGFTPVHKVAGTACDRLEWILCV